MYSTATSAVALALIGLSGALLSWHIRAWRSHLAAAAEGAPDVDSRFAWRQCRRRLQTSGMLGLVGGGMFVAQFLPLGLLALFVWGVLIVLLGWALLLAVVDGIDTRLHFQRVQKAFRQDQERWRGEVQHATNDKGEE